MRMSHKNDGKVITLRSEFTNINEISSLGWEDLHNGALQTTIVYSVGFGKVAQFAKRIMGHVLCPRHLPDWPVPQPKTLTHHIVSAHHEPMATVFVRTIPKMFVVLNGNTTITFDIPTIHYETIHYIRKEGMTCISKAFPGHKQS